MPYTEIELYNNNLYAQHTQQDKYDNTPYIELAQCVFQHICATANLSNRERLYYLLLDCESITNLKLGNNRASASTGVIWAKRLGCSKSQIFTMQKSLERKRYLQIERSTNDCNQNNRNLLFTSLPKNVFEELVTDHDTNRLTIENKDNADAIDRRLYLDRTKILLKFDFALFRKIVASRQITYRAKLFCIDYYSPCYLPNIRIGSKGLFYSTFTYASLMERYNITKGCLSKILMTLDRLRWIHKCRVEKFINPPIWNAYWHIENIKNAV